MKTLQLLKRTVDAARNVVAEAQAQLDRVRAEGEAARAEAQELARAWLHAASQTEAEEIDRRRRELLRVGERAEAQIPELETQLITAKAEKQREALARHRQIIAACVPRLISAVEAAAAVQVEAIVLRNRAVKELGESVVQAKIPAVGYLGLLIPDLVRQWATELRRSFDPPALPRLSDHGCADGPGRPRRLCQGLAAARGTDRRPGVLALRERLFVGPDVRARPDVQWE